MTANLHPMTGILYIVATPIGNLEDLTFRARRILAEADLIACEDTRQSRKLLQHYGIHQPTVSYHEHNEAARTAELLDRLERGARIAVISDAGTPLVSDPGFRLVSQAVQRGIPVVPIPGPAAFVAALSASGMPSDAFHFGGFLPHKSGQRRKVLESLKQLPATLIFYETPHRIIEALEDVHAALGPRLVVIGREITKLHEEFLRGTPEELISALRSRDAVKGEITLLIDRTGPSEAPPESIPEEVRTCIRSGMPRMDAIKEVARRRGLPKREVYRMVEEPED